MLLISERITESSSSAYSKVVSYLDSLSVKEIEVLTPLKIAEHLNVDKGTAGIYLHEYRTEKNIALQTTKQKVFKYLDSLSEEDLLRITYTKLAKKLKINENTASMYLTKYRKSLQEKIHQDTKSQMKLVFEFIEKNPDKRMAIDIAKEFPQIEAELISSYVSKWYRLHPDLQMEKGARGIAKLKNWTEEELECLREHKYRVYCKIMKRLERIPKPSYSQPTMDHFEDIKGELSEKERKEYTQEKALDISTNNALFLLEKVFKKFPEIDLKKTKSIVIELRKRLASLGRDRPASTIVGTAIYLANRDFTPSDTNKIMEKFGKCSRASISQLCDLLRMRRGLSNM